LNEHCADLCGSHVFLLQAEASGDSDKSKSEINDEEDASEVRPSTPTLAISVAAQLSRSESELLLLPKSLTRFSETISAGRRVMRPSKAAAAEGEERWSGLWCLCVPERWLDGCCSVGSVAFVVVPPLVSGCCCCC
jgi:hypothetical protein